MAKLDHIMYSCLDLDQGIQDLELITGIKAVFGGVHPRQGSRNALLSLGNAQYFEIIAPDPEQDIKSELVTSQGIKTWAVASSDLQAQEDMAEKFGLRSRRISMSRDLPDGGILEWELLFVTGHDLGYQFPFFINWLGNDNPSSTTPKGCELLRFSISSENAEELESLMSVFMIEGVKVDSGKPGMQAILNTPKGEVRLS